MDEQKNLQNTEPEQDSEEKRYVPRPKWQLAIMAWFFLILIILGTILYYYWIAHKY